MATYGGNTYFYSNNGETLYGYKLSDVFETSYKITESGVDTNSTILGKSFVYNGIGFLGLSDTPNKKPTEEPDYKIGNTYSTVTNKEINLYVMAADGGNGKLGLNLSFADSKEFLLEFEYEKNYVIEVSDSNGSIIKSNTFSVSNQNTAINFQIEYSDGTVIEKTVSLEL